MLTKYVVGANANPPKKLSSPPKKGKVMPMNIVNAAWHKANIDISISFFVKNINVYGCLKENESLPTYKLRVIKRRVRQGEKWSFFTSTVSIMSNTGMA